MTPDMSLSSSTLIFLYIAEKFRLSSAGIKICDAQGYRITFISTNGNVRSWKMNKLSGRLLNLQSIICKQATNMDLSQFRFELNQISHVAINDVLLTAQCQCCASHEIRIGCQDGRVGGSDVIFATWQSQIALVQLRKHVISVTQRISQGMNQCQLE